MFLMDTKIRVFQISIKALLLMFILLFNLDTSFSTESKGKESEEFIITPNKVSRSKVIEVAKQCLERSTHKEEYLINKFKVHYDNASQVWGIEFKKKSNEEDVCMYGAIVEKNTGSVMCQCLYGL